MLVNVVMACPGVSRAQCMVLCLISVCINKPLLVERVSTLVWDDGG